MKKVTQILIIAFIGVVTVNTAKAQIYDPLAVQRINDLIANNGLQATPDAPETWEFAAWNDEEQKHLIRLHLTERGIIGAVSFAGLETLHTLICSGNSLSRLDLTDCLQLKWLACSGNNLTELVLSNCNALQWIECGSNSLTQLDVTKFANLQLLYCWANKFTELDLTNNTQLRYLSCGDAFVTKLDVRNCPQLEWLYCSYGALTELYVRGCAKLRYLNCYYNALIDLDLTGLDNLTDFDGEFQFPTLTLYENAAGEYTLAISLNNPIFGSDDISYSEGILKCKNNMVVLPTFKVQTNKEGFEVNGQIVLNYSTVGINSPEKIELKVYPNPTAGELRIENDELKIEKIEVFDIVGKIVSSNHFNASLPNHEINLSHLNSGIYFVKVVTEQGVAIEKVVKQ